MEGLSIGGGGISLGNTQKGYILFMRGGEKVDKERYKLYRDKIFLPYVNDTRNKYDSFLHDGITPIPDALTAVSWCDGDISQIANIVEDIDVYTSNKIIANKQSAARSGTEHAADLCKVFPCLKKMDKIYTVSDIPVEQHPMKRLLLHTFHKLSQTKKICLKSNKQKALVDFLSTLPEIATRACTKKTFSIAS